MIIQLLGLGGWLNRLGWDELDGWNDPEVGELLEDHHEDTGCQAPEADWFSEYPEDYWCHYCGALL